MNESPDPRERKHRPRVLKGASIIRGINDSEIRCTIRNMHDQGAKLDLPEGVTVPRSFLLYVPHDEVGYRCELRWRDGDSVGVAFTGREQKPSWHYG